MMPVGFVVSVEEGPVPARLEGPAASGVLWQARAGEFLIDVPGVARFLVTGGRRVVAQSHAGAAPERVARFLHMAPLAALLYQRGIFACHAACVATAKGAVVIGGLSGAGKSTLAAALAARGCALLSDDISWVELDAAERPAARATESEIRLWPDAVAHGFRSEVKSYEGAEAVPLCAVVRLIPGTPTRTNEAPDLPVTRFELVTRMTWNSRIADALLDRARGLRIAGAVARAVPVVTLFRSRVRWEAEELADSILERWG